MRRILTLADAQIVIKDILNRLDTLENKDLDMKGRKIVNLGAAQKSNDAVILSQLQSSQVPQGPSQDYFSIPFSKDGIVSVGDLVPPYNPGQGRSGKPYQVILDAIVPPVSAPLTMNMQINGLSILTTPISLPIAATGAVISSNFIHTLPMVNFKGRIVPIVVSTDGATAGVTITLVVQKS